MVRTKFLALGFIGFLLLLSPSIAFAHGELVTTSPVQGSTLISVPTEVSLVFDANLQTLGAAVINSITVTTDTGVVISDAVKRVSANSISTTITNIEATGTMSVHYRIVSEDGHPVEGDYSFTVSPTPIVAISALEESAEAVTQVEESAKAKPKGLVVSALVLMAGILALVQKKRAR